MGLDKNYLGAGGTMLVLALLCEEDLYGYEIIRRLETRSEMAFPYKEGTLYPVLHKLEAGGYVKAYTHTTEANRVRKYYAITPKGRKQLEKEKQDFAAFTGAVDKVLGPGRALAQL